jgi:hypothetical protein
MSDPPPNFDAFFMPLTNTYSVNWPHSAEACFERRPRRSRPRPSAGGDRAAAPDEAVGGEDSDDDDAVLGITPEFEAHVRELSNWSLGREFAEAFPQWRECVRIKD